MKDLVETVAAWRAGGVEMGRAVVVRAYGSSPRLAGASMLAAADGRIAGSVSGGCVEGAVVEEIAQARRTGRSRVIRYGISDEQAWDVGLACGGVIDVLVEPALGAAVEEAAMAANGPDAGGGRAVITPLPADSPDGEPPAETLVVWADGRLDGTLGDPSLDAELVRMATELLASGTSGTVELAGRSLLVEAFAARPRLVVVGAGQVAVPLVAIAHALGYETIVVDARPAFATRERYPDADTIVVGWFDEAADEIHLGPADAVAVLTHDPKVDDPALVTAFARGCRYVGAIGSRKTQAGRRERLAEAGVRPEDVERLRGPIGLDLGGRGPAESALAIMAEVVAARFGGTGLPLRDKAASRPAASRPAAAGPAAPERGAARDRRAARPQTTPSAR
jgi:xanthine dehydrogenase accessory factor